MFGRYASPNQLAGIVQVALTPVFFLSAIGVFLSVFSTRLGRVADHVDRLVDELRSADASRSAFLNERLNRLMPP